MMPGTVRRAPSFCSRRLVMFHGPGAASARRTAHLLGSKHPLVHAGWGKVRTGSRSSDEQRGGNAMEKR